MPYENPLVMEDKCACADAVCTAAVMDGGGSFLTHAWMHSVLSTATLLVN